MSDFGGNPAIGICSKAEAIIRAVMQSIVASPLEYVADGQVYRSLNHALAQGVLPAIVVNRGAAPQPQQATIAHNDRGVWVHVSALAAGPDAESLADAALVECHRRIFADRTLGGLALDMQEGEEGADTAELNTDICRLTKSYLIEYRTGTESLEN